MNDIILRLNNLRRYIWEIPSWHHGGTGLGTIFMKLRDIREIVIKYDKY